MKKKEQQQYAPQTEDDEDEDEEALIMSDEQIDAFAKAVAALMRKQSDEPAGPR